MHRAYFICVCVCVCVCVFVCVHLMNAWLHALSVLPRRANYDDSLVDIIDELDAMDSGGEGAGSDVGVDYYDTGALAKGARVTRGVVVPTRDGKSAMRYAADTHGQQQHNTQSRRGAAGRR